MRKESAAVVSNRAWKRRGALRREGMFDVETWVTEKQGVLGRYTVPGCFGGDEYYYH